jgi:hypothetical protein
VGAFTETIVVIRRRRLVEEIEELRLVRERTPYLGWAALLLWDDIRAMLDSLGGMAGAW